MGNVFMAYDPNITRGVLAVPGGDWSMLFERSNAWYALLGAAQGSYTDPADLPAHRRARSAWRSSRTIRSPPRRT